MNTILRSKMEREIEPKWECDYVTIARPHARVLAIDNGDVVFRRDGHAPMAYPLREITHVREPGGEWLLVVDDPKVEVGSVWENAELREYYHITEVTPVDIVTQAYPQDVPMTWRATAVHSWKLVPSSRIVEGMDGGRLRKFVKTGTFKRGPWQRGEWFLTQCTATPEPEKIQNCNWYWPDGGEREILIPLNFLDPAPSITPATPCTSSVHNETELEGGTKRLATVKESLQVDHQSKKYIDDLLHRLGSVGEPGAYRDMVREAKAVIESLTMKVDPLSWDANPPMVGDIVAGNTLHRPSLIGYVDTCGKVSLCCSARGIPHDEFVAAYRRLALSPLHKEAGR